MKRFIAIILALVMVVALVGCGGKKRKPIKLTLSTEDAEAILAAAGIKLPDEATAAGANSQVKWFGWYDPFQNYDEGEMVKTGYFTFTEKYHGSVEYIEVDYQERNTRLATLILSSDSPDLALAGTSNTACYPLNCLNGMYQPIDDYVDYKNDPLWYDLADAFEYFTLKDKHFVIVTDVKFKDVCPYNRRVITEWGYEDPAELYANDEWTWSAFEEMAKDFTDADANRFGVDGHYIVNGICEQSTGRYIIERDGAHFYSNMDDPLIGKGEDLIYELYRNDCFFHEGNDYWALNKYVHGHGVNEGNVLFWFCELSTGGFMETVEHVKEVWGDVEEGEIMFVPLPRPDDGDGVYYLNSTPSGYCLVTGAPNPDGAVLLASCERFKVLDPTVVNIDRKQLKEKMLWSEEMLSMWDHCKELAEANIRMFYTGNMPTNLQNTYNSIDWGIVRGNAGTWGDVRAKYEKQLEFYIDEVNAKIDAYEFTGEFNGQT